MNATYVEAKSGLRPGEQVIYAGYEGLHEGDPVVPTEWDSAGPRTLPPATGEATPGTVYTCPMHPEVRSEKPGDCPKCGMKLQPMQPGEGAAAPAPDRPARGSSAIPSPSGTSKAAAGYYCPMHPEVRSDQPGKCPKCGMDLQSVPTSAAAPQGKAGAR